MVPALISGLVLFTLVCALLIWLRTRLEGMRQQLDLLEMDAAERGLLEETG